MSRYIDRYKTIDALQNSDKDPIDILFDQPDADVRENVRGKWIKKEGSLWTLATCSVCGELSVEGNKPFCPNCGAEMER